MLSAFVPPFLLINAAGGYSANSNNSDDDDDFYYDDEDDDDFFCIPNPSTPSFDYDESYRPDWRDYVDNSDKNLMHLWDDDVNNLLVWKIDPKYRLLMPDEEGWNKEVYNGYNPFEDLDWPGANRKKAITTAVDSLRSYLNQKFDRDQRDICVFAIAMKTIDAKNYTGQGHPVPNPTYDPQGCASVGNIAFYDIKNDKHCALPQWIGIESYESTHVAVTQSMEKFVWRATDEKGIPNTHLTTQTNLSVINGIKARYTGPAPVQVEKATNDKKSFMAAMKQKIRGMFR